MADEQLEVRDNSRQGVRGTVCPQCGGKIVPSLRAVYESKDDPTEVFPLWQCERCGFEKISQRPAGAAKKPAHGAAAKKGTE
ncbi:MAG: hypothetical protein ACRD9R_05460 [Pyrinomonadaceae bacterium]